MQHPRRDMVKDVDERYYAAQYLHWLAPYLAELPHGARVLDLGCGYGRLALEIAQRRPDCTIVGLDIAPPAVAGATAHAEARGLTNCAFLERDLSLYLAEQAAESIDLALFVEVSFFAPKDLGVLPQCARVLRPKGHLYAAFRSQWFNLVRSITAGDVRSAQVVRDARDGRLWGGGNRFWWQTPADIAREFAAAGLSLDPPCYGIGVLSALRFDGIGLVQPSSLADHDRESLLALELALAEAYAAQGRYIVAIAHR